jgi:hypothetical protein
MAHASFLVWWWAVLATGCISSRLAQVNRVLNGTLFRCVCLKCAVLPNMTAVTLQLLVAGFATTALMTAAAVSAQGLVLITINPCQLPDGVQTS